MKQLMNFPFLQRHFFIFILLLGLLGRNEGNGDQILIPTHHYYATVADEYQYPLSDESNRKHS